MALSVVDPTQSVLIAAMRGAELRQTLLTSDLANADTPGFQPSDVNFQSQLSAAIANGSSETSGSSDTSGDSVSTSIANMAFQPNTSTDVAGTNGNGVDPDQTSAALAENGLLYNSLAEVLSAHDSILEYAMGTK
jgi:flagellar basal-body rod protein FlgB